MGTAGYMSPEQVRGEKLDARTDLFSFGLVLYEMATGQRAFSGHSASIIHDAILNKSPVPARALNAAIPPKLNVTIDKALEKDREHRYQSAEEMRSALELLRTKRSPFRFSWKALAAVAVLAIVGVGGWLYWQTRNRLKLTSQDTIVLADFTNRTGDPVFDDALNGALRTDLEQTPFLNILSTDKVRGALKQMGRPQDAKLTVDVARDVCLQTNSKAVVAGSIADIGNHYGLALQAVSCPSGKTLTATSMDVESRNQIVRTLGAAGDELRLNMGERKESVQKFSTPLDEATSASLEAVQAYTQGVRRVAEQFDTALAYFERAVELDQNYADAYSWLGALNYQTIPSVTRAYELRERVTQRDRFAIEHMYYRSATLEMDKAAHAYEQMIRIFPGERDAYIGLSLVLPSLAQHEKAAAAAREAIRLAPGLDGYISLMQSDIALGRFDDARATYEEAKSRKLDDERLRFLRHRLALLQGDNAAIQEQLNWAAQTPGASERVFFAQSCGEAYHGRFRSAHEYMLREIDSTRRADGAKQEAGKALRDVEVGFATRAHQEAMSALSKAPARDIRLNLALAFARTGDVSNAQKLIDALDKEFPLSTELQNYYLPTLRAVIELEKNNPRQAIELLRRAAPYKLAKTDAFDELYPVYTRGLAYLQLRQGKEAAVEFQKLLDHRGIVWVWITGALVHLQLGRAQTMMGDKASARKSYQDFLTLWKDADPDIPIYKQAKAEYAKLQ
jgi:tetratricopeptide (TPR) repeat protein